MKNYNDMSIITKEDGTVIIDPDEIEAEVLQFYGKLMREGPHVSNEHRRMLEMPITEDEITHALKSIGDLKAPGVDGYDVGFFKET
ncbi:unnamed protein product [Lathyrus sativus]|nr:unnamed protein product [Lathyrus sativus]